MPEQEYYRAVAEVDLEAAARNMRQIRNIVNPHSRIMAVVKADAYGHGAVELSRVLLANGADCLAVAILDEAKQLRGAGIDAPILILGHTPEVQSEQILEYGLTQTVFTCEAAAALSETAGRRNKAAGVHIKLDTGMGRLGFLPDEKSVEEIKWIHALPNLRVEGIFTHLASADAEDKSFALEQLQTFKLFYGKLVNAGIRIPLRHAANSACIMDIEAGHLDMVRPGVILYGLYPSNAVHKEKLELRPVMSLKTHIAFVKEVDAGKSIGYGQTFRTAGRSRIATIPVGYADGYSRLLSSSGRVLIRGQYAPVVGRVCMDQFMVDVSHIPDAVTGDEVVLIGGDGDKAVTADEIAEKTGTINYEVVCRVTKRIPRKYKIGY